MKTSASGEPGLEIIPTEVRRDKLGRRTLGRERREELLTRFATSGMTQAAFARREGVIRFTENNRTYDEASERRSIHSPG